MLAAGWASVVLLSRYPWASEPPFVFFATRVLGASVATAIVFSLMILVTRRRATLRRQPQASATLCALGGTATATLTLIGMLFYRAAAGPHAIDWNLVIAPGLLTSVLLGLTAWDAYRIHVADVRRNRGGLPG
jgi:hypothetical protein